MAARRRNSAARTQARRRIVAYCRVSTVEQAKEGVSLDAQETKLRAYCEALSDELELVAVVRDEGLSAKTLDRPGLRSALELLDAGKADGLLVTKLDRLTRSVRDLGELIEGYFREDRPASLLSLSEAVDTQTAGGRLVLNVLGSVHQWEREAIAERIQEALAYKKTKGERTGSVPYGKRLADDGVQLLDEPAEQKAVRRAVRLAGRGLSLRAIASDLAERGHRPRGGGKWHPQTVSNILRAQG